MNNWAVFAAALAITACALFATLATGAYERGPVYKPYWEDERAREEILAAASRVGVLAARGTEGVVLVGYRDQLNAPNRAELLAALRGLLETARGYTVYLAPWAEDNETKGYLSLLYNGGISPGDYLAGSAANRTAAPSPRVEQALSLARRVAETYGLYRPLGGGLAVRIPPIYAAVFRNDTSYVVYEPFTPGRDRTFRDWLGWVRNALENLRRGRGRAAP